MTQLNKVEQLDPNKVVTQGTRGAIYEMLTKQKEIIHQLNTLNEVVIEMKKKQTRTRSAK